MSDILEVRLEFPGGLSAEGVVVTRLSPGLFRLEEDPHSCLFADSEDDLRRLPNFRDEIEAEELEQGVLRFMKVVRRSSLRRFCWILHNDFFGSAAFPIFSAEIESVGGYLERVAGGVLIAHLPEDGSYDPESRLAALIEALSDV